MALPHLIARSRALGSHQRLSILRKSSTSTGYSPTASDGPSPAEISSARAYCVDLLRKYDTPSYTLLPFIPTSAQPAYLAIRAFNLEIARVADSVSTPQVGALRLQFWRDNITKTFAGSPPKQPVSLLLAHVLGDLSNRSSRTTHTPQSHAQNPRTLSKSWFLRIISAREQYLNNNPYVDMDALERYAENTYSTLLYLTLQALPMSSLSADHVCSHVGKAAGIVAVLRGLPLLAFPPPPKHHSNSTGLGGMVQDARGRSRQGVVTLPLDIMADVGVREEDVLRKGAEAPGLRDAVFRVATRASDHLITARSMVASLKRGDGVGHAFEHGDEEEHRYDSEGHAGTSAQEGQEKDGGTQYQDLERAFGVLMPAVSTGLWLEKLQRLDFDIFRDELRRREWKLPWKAYFAYRRRRF
ncbi:hypothetical protein MMC19_001646 [Ptychographa xylographoides]|nr:hypothetical protein [Ptychographa xylographoides]